MTAAADGWIVAVYECEDADLLVRVRARLPDAAERMAYPVVVRVAWPFAEDADGASSDLTEAGLVDGPDDATFLAMSRMEDALYAAMGEHRFAVGVAAITGDGERQWLFYARGADDFARHLNAALDGHPVYPITFSAEDDPDWTGFFALHPPATLH